MKQVSSLPLSLYQLLGYAFLHPFFINLLMIFLQIKELDVSEIVKGTLGSSRIPTLEEALAVMPVFLITILSLLCFVISA